MFFRAEYRGLQVLSIRRCVESDENNLAAASTDFLDSGGRIAKATTDRLPIFAMNCSLGI